MDREQFIRVLKDCIRSATHKEYPNIEMEKLSDHGLIELAELVRDVLQLRLDNIQKAALPLMPTDGNLH